MGEGPKSLLLGGVVEDNLIASMVDLRRLRGRDSVSKDELGCQSLDIAPRDWMYIRLGQIFPCRLLFGITAGDSGSELGVS